MASAFLQGFSRNTTTFAVDTVTKANAVTPKWYGGFLRDMSFDPAPLILAGPAQGPFHMQNGFWRDSAGNLAAVGAASAVAPFTFYNGFWFDSQNCLITSTASGTQFVNGFLRDAQGYLVIDTASGPPPAAFVLDNFNDTANNPLTSHTPDIGPEWTFTSTGSGSVSTALQLSGDGDVYRTTSAGGVYQVPLTIPQADYQIDCVINVKSILTSDAVLIFGRMVDSQNYYRIVMHQAGDITLAKLIANAATTLGTVANETLTAGQEYTLSLRMQGSAISVLWNGTTVVGPVTDTTYSAAGQTGLYIGSSSSTNQTNSTGMQFDTFTVGPVPT